MSGKWRVAMMLPWLVLAAMIFDIWRVYDQLPAVIASHFNAAGAANGFAPKQQVFTSILVIVFGLLCMFTFVLTRLESKSGLAWLVLVFEFWAVGLVAGLVHGMLQVGIGEAQTLEFPIGMWSLLCGAALVIGEVFRIKGVRREADTDRGRLIAEEVHGSPAFGLVFAGAAVAMTVLPTLLGAGGPGRVIPIVIGVVILGCAIWAWSGFRYRITTAGLEIRMLGMPIRFIPAFDIQSVQAQSCNPLTDFGGWGIRGIGKLRAYIWGGNRCVHIRTHAGDDIYLGFNDADRLVGELESMTVNK